MKIRCPDGSEKTVGECRECSKCFPKPITRMLLQGRDKKKRNTERQRFGVTRLVGNCLRKTYYEYTEPVAHPLDKLWIFTRGTAIHEFVQKNIPKEDSEIFKELKFASFDVIGFVDAVHDGALYEFKTTANIPEEPQEAHVLQAQAYYSMLSKDQQKKVKNILIIYFSMHKIKVFEVAPRDVCSYLEARGAILVKALKSSVAPKREESWLCDYCDHKDICHGHKEPTHQPKATSKQLSTKSPELEANEPDAPKQFDIFSFD